MSGPGQTKGTTFIDDGVDTRLPAPSPSKPVSSGDIIGANWTLSGQDIDNGGLQAEIDAYAPILNELGTRAPRDWLGNQKNYFGAYRSSHPYNYGAIWDDIAKYRATDPNFLKDVPAKNAEEFTAWVKTQELQRRRQAQDVVGREQGFGQKALGFGTGVVSSFRDPINLGAMLLTGPVSGGARSLLSTVARDAITNMAIETIELPSIATNRSRFGEDMSPLDMLEDVGMAGVAGAAFPVAGRAGKVAVKPVIDIAGNALEPAVRATQRTLAPWALGRAKVSEASDAEIARSFADSVPFAARTPEAQAGLYVLDREAEIQGASPYLKTPGGLDANAEKLTATVGAIGKPATAGRRAAPATGQPRATTPLTQDRVINFVLTDLEGGGKVVNLGDGGGLTKYGVTERGNPDVDVANLSQAYATRIARQRYWLPEFNRADPRVAAIAFDANYIANPKLARRIITEAGDDVDKALSIYREHLNHLADTNPEKARFRKGWNNRLDKLGRFVGDAEAGRVQLDPSGFEGDDVAYRAAQEQLNADELRLADDTPRGADPVRDFVDRIGAGEDLSAPDLAAFRSSNSAAIDAELARRADLGTDGHPDPLAMPAGSAPAEKLDLNVLADRVAELIAADHSTNPTALARSLGTDVNTASRALSTAAGRPDSGLRVATKTGRVSRAPVFRGPKDVLRTIVEAGGIRDDEGHGLRKGGRDLGQFFIPGVGKLVSMKHGLPIDRIGEMLHEGGFFRERPSTADVLDMVERATFGEKIYSLHDTAALADRGDADAAQANEQLLDQAHDVLIDRVPQDAIDDALTHDVAYLIAQGVESGEAVGMAIDWRERSMLDMIHSEVEDPDYDFRTAQTDAFGAETGDPGRFGEGDDGREAFAGYESGSPAGDEPARWAPLDGSHGAAADAAEEAGLNGPPPLDPKASGIDDAIGPEAARIADSLEHDVKAALKATVAADATGPVMLSGVFVAPHGKPGFHIEDSHGDGEILYSVFRDDAGTPKGVVAFPTNSAAVEAFGGVVTFIDPAFRRQGIATKLYDQLRAAGHDVDAISGTGDLTPSGAAFVNRRRSRLDLGELIDPAIAEKQRQQGALKAASPLQAKVDQEGTIGLGLFDVHHQPDFMVELDGAERPVRDVVAELDRDAAAITAARNCL